MTRARLAGLALALVLVPAGALAALLTLLRLLGPEGGWPVRVVAFTPFAAPLYLVVALGCGLLAWRRRAVLAAGAAALALLGLSLHVAWLAPLHAGEAPRQDPDAEPLVVAGANLLAGRADPEAIAALVAEHDVDVLVLTEVTPGFLAALGPVLRYRAGAAAEDVAGTVVLSATPIRTVARLDTVFGGWVVRTAGLTVVAAHPVAPVGDAAAWRSDHALVLAAAERHDADVVVGDLNATLDHVPVQRLVDAGWRDAVELANGGWTPTWPAAGTVSFLPRPVVQIDHVLVRDRWAVTGVEVADVPGSDHLAVVASVAPAA